MMKMLVKFVILAAALVAFGVQAAQKCLDPFAGPSDPVKNDCGGGVVVDPNMAQVPFVVNFTPIDGHDSASVVMYYANMTDRAFPEIEFTVKSGEEIFLGLSIDGEYTGIRSGAQRRTNASAIINNRAGKVTLNLSAQAYKNAEVSLYTVNGKRVLRNTVSASSASNYVSRRNVAPGVYLLSVKGAEGGAVTSRLTHKGGNLDIKVAFGGEISSYTPRLSKKTDEPVVPGYFWTIRVSAFGYADTGISFTPVAGMNDRLAIDLSPTPAGASPLAVFKVTAKELAAPNTADPAAKTVAVGANDFAFRLGAKLAERVQGQNFVFSPYSVWMPFAALVNATDDKYKAELITALGASGVTQDDINKAASRMLYNLTKLHYSGRYAENYKNPLKIANAIFVDKKVTLLSDFAQAFMDYYRGSSINVDFESQDAVDAVNKWASDNTDGLIKEVINEFNKTTIAAVANSIYFSDSWASEIDTNRTKEGDFHAPTGDTRVPYMLRTGRDQPYYEDDKMQAVSLKFRTGGGMCVILPKEGAGSVEELYSSMTNSRFAKIRDSSILSEGRLKLPRFSVENDVKGLKEGLEMLGVPLFERENNPVSKLIKPFYDYVWVSDVVQKAVIKVDEKGTTAAAVTVVTIDGATSVPPSQRQFEMVCDRPFMFVLYDYTYDGGDQVLFTGIVNKP